MTAVIIAVLCAVGGFGWGVAITLDRLRQDQQAEATSPVARLLDVHLQAQQGLLSSVRSVPQLPSVSPVPDYVPGCLQPAEPARMGPILRTHWGED